MGKLKFYENKKLIDPYKSAIEDYINKIPTKDILQNYGISRTHFYTILRQEGVIVRKMEDSKKKFSLNPSFFIEPYAFEDGYIFGFFMADGCNYQNKLLSLAIAEKDKYILYEMSKFIFEKGSYLPIYFQKTKNPNWQNKYCLRICDKKLTDKFNRMGCKTNKSLSLSFENLAEYSKEFQKGFILGFFDGDGWITKSNNEVGFVSSNLHCKQLQDFFETQKICSFIYNKGKVSQCLIRQKKSIKKFKDWLYEPLPPLFLKRKFNTFK